MFVRRYLPTMLATALLWIAPCAAQVPNSAPPQPIPMPGPTLTPSLPAIPSAPEPIEPYIAPPAMPTPIAPPPPPKRHRKPVNPNDNGGAQDKPKKQTPQ